MKKTTQNNKLKNRIKLFALILISLTILCCGMACTERGNDVFTNINVRNGGDLYWTKIKGAKYYNVFDGLAQVNDEAVKGTSFHISDLSEKEEYELVVIAYDKNDKEICKSEVFIHIVNGSEGMRYEITDKGAIAYGSKKKDTVPTFYQGKKVYAIYDCNVGNLPSSVEEIHNSEFSGKILPIQLIYFDAMWTRGDIDQTSLSAYNKYFVMENHCLYSKDKKKLYRFTDKEAKEFAIPNSVEVIAKYAFNQCKLEKLILSDSVKKLEEFAFAYMIDLKSIEWGKGIKIIPSYCFYYAFSIGHGYKELRLPDTVQQIDDYAFSAAHLDTLYIPKSVEHLRNLGLISVVRIEINGEQGESYPLTVYCEAESKPDGWAETWYYSDKEDAYFKLVKLLFETELTQEDYITIVWGCQE